MSTTTNLLAEIEGTMAPGDAIDVKRFYIPGVKLSCPCPKCGIENVRDFGDDYLSYPIVGEPFTYTMYCRCEHEWPVNLVLRVSLEVVP